MFAGWEYPTRIGDPRARVAWVLGTLSWFDLGCDNEQAGSLTIRSTFAFHIELKILCRTYQRNRLTEEDAARAARSPVLLLGIPRKKRR